MNDRKRIVLMGGFAVLVTGLAVIDAAAVYDDEGSRFDFFGTILFAVVLAWQWYSDRFRRPLSPEVVDAWYVLAMMALLFS